MIQARFLARPVYTHGMPRRPLSGVPSSLDLPAFEPPSSARSRNMAAMRGRDTKPELLVRRALHAAGFRYRLHPKDVPGRPDIVLPRYRRVVLVQGCFWHGHGCARAPAPRSNQAYWLAKIAMNRQRDERTRSSLSEQGWQITELWQCELAEGITGLLALLAQERHLPRTRRESRPSGSVAGDPVRPSLRRVADAPGSYQAAR